MKTFALIALAATAKLVSAHSTVQAAWINDVDQGLGNNAAGFIRSPPNNSPLVNVQSKDMTCNVNNQATAKTLKVKAGDKFTFEWHHESRSSGDQIIDPSHNGPVLVYIAPTAAGAAGNGWVKIAEDGYDGKWAVERLRANGGKHSITIPDIAAGQYLLRPEIIALHEGYRVDGAQFYMECVQIEITSAGSKTLPAGVSIPGAYSAQDKGILFDLYNGFSSYPIPGPAVWDGVSGGSPAPAPTSSAPAAATTTKAPAATTTKPPAAATTTTKAPTAVPTTLRTLTRTTTAAAPPAATTPATGSGSAGTVAEWQQCGGINYKGATTCKAGLNCKQWNPYYFQCVGF